MVCPPGRFRPLITGSISEGSCSLTSRPSTRVGPCALVEISLLFALRGYFRAFYRWLSRDCAALFAGLPERTRLHRLLLAHPQQPFIPGAAWAQARFSPHSAPVRSGGLFRFCIVRCGLRVMRNQRLVQEPVDERQNVGQIVHRTSLLRRAQVHQVH